MTEDMKKARQLAKHTVDILETKVRGKATATFHNEGKGIQLLAAAFDELWQVAKREAGAPRTAQEIVDQTNALAREFYRALGYVVAEGFDFRKSEHPQELSMWNLSCIAQEVLTDTSVEDAEAELEDA